jgi:hypothetical protein
MVRGKVQRIEDQCSMDHEVKKTRPTTVKGMKGRTVRGNASQ